MNHRGDPVELVAEVAREEDVCADPRWEALAAGTISEADHAALRALAERSETARLAYEALRPDEGEPRASGEARPAASIVATRSPAKPISKGRWRSGALLAACLAVVAGASLLVLRPAAIAPLPAYEIAEADGDRSQRSPGADPARPLRVGPRSRLLLVLRPVIPAEGPVAVTAALAREGSVQRWDAPVEISADGSVRIVAPREAAFRGVAPGAWDLLLAVGRRGALPPTPEALAAASATPDRGPSPPFRTMRVRLVLHDGEPDRAERTP